MKKGFTLIEVVVAVGLLAMVIAFSSVIFKVSIETRRTAGANAEIMQKLRAITNQLNRDFAGLRPDAPLFIMFRQDDSPTNPDPNQRYDQIMFFADGDFQSTQLYSGTPKVPATTGTPVVGNVARIYYGQAMVWREFDNTWRYPWWQQGDNEPEQIFNKRQRTFGRRVHILTADPTLDRWPDINDVVNSFDDNLVDGTKTYLKNELYEHDSLSLSQWKTFDVGIYDNISVIDTIFDRHVLIDMNDPKTFHNLFCPGVVSFAIQWAYWDPGVDPLNRNDDVLRWFPSNNPDGTGTYSHFDMMNGMGFGTDPKYSGFGVFGAFFGVASPSRFGIWSKIGDEAEYRLGAPNDKFAAGFYPPALKFTFRIYDSKGIIKGGRTFTHIVYLGN